MLTWNTIVLTCLAYVTVLFAIAFWAEERARRGRMGWLRSPLIYTLSISVYCTAWTYYGAVGSAARGGLDYIAIYLGPTLTFIGWWYLLRKLVRIARDQRITSIADILSSRYGKSTRIGVIVTFIAVIATTPYIALQLQSLTVSFAVFSTLVEGDATPGADGITAFWIAMGLALFTILFGTRNVDANERHYGVVTAIAVEAVVKLVAVTSVGLYVVFWLADGPAEVFATPVTEELLTSAEFGPRWVTLLFLSATAVVCLPRMFQVTVVENVDERHLATAAWAFPLYVCLISLFVLPIAITGLQLMPEGTNPDLYVLTVPLLTGQNTLALLAFLGGFSAATSMVIVSAIALSTRKSNNVIMPVWIWMRTPSPEASGDVRGAVLISRRVSIGVILGLGYIYYRLTSGSEALASIGLISFLGAAQLLPSLVAGLYWHRATRAGAITAVLAGFAVWAYTLFLPSFGGGVLVSEGVLEHGPFGIALLKPQDLFGAGIADPLVHALVWSMMFNVGLLIVGSLLSRQTRLEPLQAEAFINVFGARGDGDGMRFTRTAKSEDLFELAQRILGRETAHRIFAEIARSQGKPYGLPDPAPDLTARLERELAGAIGAASAHAMVSQISGRGRVSVGELIRMADETAQIVNYAQELEAKSRELEETAAQLRRANAQLTRIGEQKDAFLSQVSHELRTPMTSIRSFAEILRSTDALEADQAARFTGIIHEESMRLTRLLDEILDLSVLESGRVALRRDRMEIATVLDQAIASTAALTAQRGVRIHTDLAPGLAVDADVDRLAQVMINVISNAVKYGLGDPPEIRITSGFDADSVVLDIADNGPGIPRADQGRVFEKFARLGESTLAGSAGLGLPISREIMRNLGGDLELLARGPGATFRLRLPRPGAHHAAAE